MTDITAGGATGVVDRFDAIEATLARYPHLDEGELADLKHWFRREASAFEVASLASKDALREPYRRFRAEHIDRFGLRDLVAGTIGATLIAGVIAGLYLLA
jgi:hypothetical protein